MPLTQDQIDNAGQDVEFIGKVANQPSGFATNRLGTDVKVLAQVIADAVQQLADADIGNSAAALINNSLKAVSGQVANPSTPQRWTPAQGDLLAWWDPTDRLSLTLVGSVVDRMSDKSGNGRHMVAFTGDKRPGYDTNGPSPNLVFNGTGLGMLTALTTINQPITMVAVVFDTGGSQGQQTALDIGNRIIMRTRQGNGPFLNAGGTLSDQTGSYLPKDGYHVLYGVLNGDDSGALGVDAKNPITGVVGSLSSQNLPISIGDSVNSDAPMTGGFGGALIYKGSHPLGSELLDRAVGYYAWSFKFHESLPSTHPYRYAPPVTGKRPVPTQLVNRGPAFIPHGPAGSWYETNIFDPRIIEDPLDPNYVLLYTTGQAAPVSTGKASIGLWRAPKTNPSNVSFVGIVLTEGTSGRWDGQTAGGNGVRLGSIVPRGGNVVDLYYASQPVGAIGRARSTDGGRTFPTRTVDPILTPTGQGRNDGNDVSNPFVLPVDGQDYMIYSYRTASETLPGYRFARVDADGVTCTKIGEGDVLSRPHRGLNMESMQLLRRDNKFYIIFEMGGNPSDSTPYRNYIAVSDKLLGPYAILKPVVMESGANSTTTDKYHVATPFLANINGQDILFWQGGGELAQPYYNNHWDLFAAQATNIF